jgi:hypothetical protein
MKISSSQRVQKRESYETCPPQPAPPYSITIFSPEIRREKQAIAAQIENQLRAKPGNLQLRLFSGDPPGRSKQLQHK